MYTCFIGQDLMKIRISNFYKTTNSNLACQSGKRPNIAIVKSRIIRGKLRLSDSKPTNKEDFYFSFDIKKLSA